MMTIGNCNCEGFDCFLSLFLVRKIQLNQRFGFRSYFIYAVSKNRMNVDEEVFIIGIIDGYLSQTSSYFLFYN